MLPTRTFGTMSKDVCTIVGSTLEVNTLFALVKTCRIGREFFQANLDRKGASKLLALVTTGDQDAAVALFRKQPRLLYTPIDRLNPNSTVWHFVQMARDIPMIYGFLNSLPKDSKHRLTKEADLVRVALLNRVIPNVPSNLTEFRQNLMSFLKQSVGKSQEERNSLMIQLIGGAQAKLYANILQLICEPNKGFLKNDFKELTQSRSLLHLDYPNRYNVFPTDQTGIGKRYALMPHEGDRFVASKNCNIKQEDLVNFIAAAADLDATRTSQMQDLPLILSTNTLTMPKAKRTLISYFKKQPETRTPDELFNADLNTILSGTIGF